MRTHLPLGRLVCCATAVATVAAAAAVAAPTAYAAAPQTPAVATLRTTDGAYDVYVDGIKRISVAVSDPAYTVSVVADPTRHQAAVLADFDGTAGTQLRTLDLASGLVTSLASGRIASPVYSATGALAYIADGQVVAAGGTVAKLGGRDPRLIGWSADQRSLIVETHPQEASQATYLPTIARLDVATGHLATLLASDPARGVVYRDVKQVTVNSVPRISYVRAPQAQPCGTGTSAVGLADEDGTVIAETGATADTYRSAFWSADGTSVAVEMQACVSKTEKAAGRAAALSRLNATNGVYILHTGSANRTKVVSGLSADFPVVAYTDGTVMVGNSRFGTRSVDPAAGVTGEALDQQAKPKVTTLARTNSAVFSHQLWDTDDTFDGNSACGPTSAIMNLATYQIPNSWPMTVHYPSTHTAWWGQYVTHQFTNNGHTFSRYQPDASGLGSWRGAYGWMVLDYRVGTYWSEMNSFLAYNGAHVTQGMFDAAWVRARVNENYLIVTSGMYAYGRYAHIGLITGYTDDGRFVVNDPYGNGTDGSWDGAGSIYSWDYIQPSQFWAA